MFAAAVLYAAFISLAGPALLLLVGANAWPLFVTAWLCIALCLWFARVCWGRYRQSEVFGRGLIAAVVIGCLPVGWLWPQRSERL